MASRLKNTKLSNGDEVLFEVDLSGSMAVQSDFDRTRRLSYSGTSISCRPPTHYQIPLLSKSIHQNLCSDESASNSATKRGANLCGVVVTLPSKTRDGPLVPSGGADV
jgi:hypothetical protein